MICVVFFGARVFHLWQTKFAFYEEWTDGPVRDLFMEHDLCMQYASHTSEIRFVNVLWSYRYIVVDMLLHLYCVHCKL